MTPPSIDQILANLQDGAKEDSSSIDKLIALKRLEMEESRQTREASERERARAEERAGKSDLMKTLATIAAPIIAAMMNKPAIDPALVAILGGRNSGEELKQFMEISREQARMQLDTTVASLTKIMEVKDAMNERIMEKAIEAAESGENDNGIMGILSQVAKIAGPILSAPAAQPAQAPALPGPQAGQPAAPQQAPRKPADAPALVVLRTLRKIHQEPMTPKQLRTAKASLVVVILQDDALVEALLADDENALVSYCTPIVLADKALAEWINLPAFGDKKSSAEWLVDFVKDELVPRVDYEINGDSDDDADDAGDKTQDELNASNTAP